MSEAGNHSDLIALWPSVREYADDVGLKLDAAKKIRARGRIPQQYWLPTVAAAERRGIEGVTLARLAEISAHRESTPSVGADVAA